jgi:hypothetical protein
VGGNDWTGSRNVVSWCSVWVLTRVCGLGKSLMGLGTAYDLLRMSSCNIVLVNRERGDIRGKAVARGRGSWGRGLPVLDHVNSGNAGDFLRFFGGPRVVKVVLIVILHVLVIFLLVGGEDNLDLTTEHQVKAITTGRFLEARDTSSLAPLVQFPTKRIGFCIDRAKLTGSNQPVSARSMDVGNRRVDDRRLGGATDLGEVWQKSGEI